LRLSIGAKSLKLMADLLTSHLLERLAELALAADPQTRAGLTELAGKRMRIVSTLPRLELTLAFQDQGLQVIPQASDSDAEPTMAPHAQIRGSGLDMLNLLAGKGTGKLQLDGDPQLLQRFASIAQGYRPQPPQAPPPWLNQAMGLASEGIDLLGAAVGATKRQAQSEMATRFTNSDDLGTFLDDLFQLRLQVDRLQARLDRLDS